MTTPPRIDAPTEPGWYWANYVSEVWTAWVPVEVIELNGKLAMRGGYYVDHMPPRTIWAGPITPPEAEE